MLVLKLSREKKNIPQMSPVGRHEFPDSVEFLGAELCAHPEQRR